MAENILRLCSPVAPPFCSGLGVSGVLRNFCAEGAGVPVVILAAWRTLAGVHAGADTRTGGSDQQSVEEFTKMRCTLDVFASGCERRRRRIRMGDPPEGKVPKKIPS